MAEKMVRIACSIPGGLALRLVTHFDDGTGFKQSYFCGDPVYLQGPRSLAGGVTPESRNVPAIVTEVPISFWREWKNQNAKASLLLDGYINEVRDDDDDPRRAAAKQQQVDRDKQERGHE